MLNPHKSYGATIPKLSKVPETNKLYQSMSVAYCTFLKQYNTPKSSLYNNDNNSYNQRMISPASHLTNTLLTVLIAFLLVFSTPKSMAFKSETALIHKMQTANHNANQSTICESMAVKHHEPQPQDLANSTMKCCDECECFLAFCSFFIDSLSTGQESDFSHSKSIATLIPSLHSISHSSLFKPPKTA